MINVIETFSGIGSQAKALKNVGIDYKISAIVEWDIYAFCAYDLIHNGPRDIRQYQDKTKEDLITELEALGLSTDGKNPTDRKSLRMMSTDTLRHILVAIKRTNNLVDITKVQGGDLPKKIDLLTYSFPCQDLSICGAWHGNNSGIDRNAHNRSGMLWEIERIIKQRVEAEQKLPRFLLMENVSNILSKTHRGNFQEWKNYLAELGYVNQVYTLNATNFGVPQRRVRTYMLSVFCPNKAKKQKVENYFANNDLQEGTKRPLEPLINYLRVDYRNHGLYLEACKSQPNNTQSRQHIYEDNDVIFDGVQTCVTAVNTLTTKQDRNPNSGVLEFPEGDPNKARYRNLTARECFLLMGFEDVDYEAVMDNNFYFNSRRQFFTMEKLTKMAGNSIVVNVLEEIFKQVDEIDKKILRPYLQKKGKGKKND